MRSPSRIRTRSAWIRLIGIGVFLIAAGPSLAQTGWFAQSSPVTVDLHDLDLVGPGAGWIVGAQGTILRTDDGGATWIEQESGTSYGLRGIGMQAGGLGVAVGEGGTILRTTNGGTEWVVIRTDWMDTFRAVHLLDDSFACAVGTNAIFQPWAATSTDGGRTWSFHNFYIQGNEGGLTDVAFLDSERGFASAYLWDGRGAIVRTTDGGGNWSPAIVTPAALYAIDFADTQVGMACGLAGAVYRTTDGGATWNPQSTGLGRDGLGIRLSGPDFGWVVGRAGSIAHTTDGGASWNPQDSGTVSDLNRVDFVDRFVGAAVGAGGTIRRTITGGMTGSGIESAPVAGSPDAGLRLLACPNPFRESTAILLRSGHSVSTRVEIIDPLGRRIRRVDSAAGGTGERGWKWDGRDDRGARAPAGVYFVRIDGDGPQGPGIRLLKIAD